ncbi:MerR family transcriptional regulator [Cellvibrio sp. UBA7671]|uniref:MerR family transcriptional regulator n=1 Tax=Cellvibrio sp. UBA7671 TaxID=1946312 RepID=UPI002F3534C7
MSIIVETEGDGVLVEDAVPIREISRVTGVNTVTLRAWERRYGLLIPQRTSKGHRLYSRSDIDRVKEIQVWLGRGLAIGKVKALLADEQRGDLVPEIDSIWLQLAQQIQMTITAFNRNQLERLIEETFSLYPVPMIADYLLLPLIAELQGEEPGRPVRRAFFTAVLLEYIQAAQSRQRHAAQGEKILMVSAAPDEDPLLPAVLNYGLLVNQYQAEFLGYLSAKESLLAAEALATKIVVIIGSETVNTSELQLHLSLLQERSATAVVLTGNVARVVRALVPEFSTGYYACDSQQRVLTTINQLLKG